MARSRLTETTQDLVADGGAILWSLVKGEQLELPITLNFVEDASVKPAGTNYTYEAVVVEADNVNGQSTRPTSIKAGGVARTLFVRLPILLGSWDPVSSYNKEEVVIYDGIYYKLGFGVARTSSVPPPNDPSWVVTQLNKIYVQFPKDLISSWSVQPVVDGPVYAFFELRVTEPNDPVFIRTFKPVRGMVEVLFSPTDAVVDVVYQTT